MPLNWLIDINNKIYLINETVIELNGINILCCLQICELLLKQSLHFRSYNLHHKCTL
jgi:hypothetical protein